MGCDHNNPDLPQLRLPQPPHRRGRQRERRAEVQRHHRLRRAGPSHISSAASSSAMTAQSATATATIPTEISPMIRSAALKSAIICLTWHRKSLAMTRRRVQTAPLRQQATACRQQSLSARRFITRTGRGLECGVRIMVIGLPDM